MSGVGGGCELDVDVGSSGSRGFTPIVFCLTKVPSAADTSPLITAATPFVPFSEHSCVVES
jgi:hypothetical protein